MLTLVIPRLIIWDLDDTLFNTETYVKVIDKATGECVEEITTHDYKAHSLAGDGYRYEFNWLTNAEYFVKASQPIRISHQIFAAEQHLSKQLPDYDMAIVTGRSTFDNQELFLSHLNSFSIDTKHVPVICVGQMEGATTAERKVTAIKQLTSRKTYKSVLMYDDDDRNIHAVKPIIDCHFRGYHFDGKTFREIR